MTTTSLAPTRAESGTVPRRITLVALSVAFLAFFAVLMALGSDNQPDADVKDLIASYDQSAVAFQVMSYAGMVACALLIFLGAGMRTALRSGTHTWTADAAGFGFVVVALTIASWGVTGLAMWHAVDIGDEAMIRSVNLLDTSNFLPLMLGMICVYVGAGTTGLRTGTLPRWLALVSVALGCLAPFGPLGFVPAMLLPLWLIAVAVTVRLDAEAA